MKCQCCERKTEIKAGHKYCQDCEAWILDIKFVYGKDEAYGSQVS